jgi:hypothetical protein
MLIPRRTPSGLIRCPEAPVTIHGKKPAISLWLKVNW